MVSVSDSDAVRVMLIDSFLFNQSNIIVILNESFLINQSGILVRAKRIALLMVLMPKPSPLFLPATA